MVVAAAVAVETSEVVVAVAVVTSEEVEAEEVQEVVVEAVCLDLQ
jgi:hypothetical protein